MGTRRWGTGGEKRRKQCFIKLAGILRGKGELRFIGRESECLVNIKEGNVETGRKHEVLLNQT